MIVNARASRFCRIGLMLGTALFVFGCESTSTRFSEKYASNGSAINEDGVIFKMEKRNGSNMMNRECRTADVPN